MSEDYVMRQAFKNMTPLFNENRKLELLGGIIGLIWIIAGLFNDPFLLFGAIASGVIVFVALLFDTIVGPRKGFDINNAALRRTITAGLAHWAYTSGRNAGPSTFTFVNLVIPIEDLSSLVLVSFLLIWFGTRSYDTLKDENITDTIVPLIVIRSLLRGGILAGLVFAIFSKKLIPSDLAFPYLFVIYLLEPAVHYLYQNFNRTYSRVELNFGNARLPIVALRESFLSNTVYLMFTFWFKGVAGDEWQVLRMLYIIGLVAAIVFSYDSVKEFAKYPLGKDVLGEFLSYTPDTLGNLDLKTELGHVITDDFAVQLTKDSEIHLDKGAVIVPIDTMKDKVNALIIGNGASVIEQGGSKIAENLDGVTSVLIPLKEMKKLKKQFIAEQLQAIDFSELQLPSLEKIQSLVASLSINMENWATALAEKLGKIDLSNYGITTEGDDTLVNLPGIYVNETAEYTQVKIAGIVKVYESPDVETVRVLNVINVVEFPRASFVSLPGITVFDVDGVGSAVSIFGLKISDGIPADRLEEFKLLMLQYMDSMDASADAQLGRILADRNASGIMNVSISGEFKPLLTGQDRSVGDHPALTQGGGAKTAYLPANFKALEESASKKPTANAGFIALTGMGQDPVIRDVNKIRDRIDRSIKKIDRLERKRDRLLDRQDDDLGDDREIKDKLKDYARRIDQQEKKILKLRSQLQDKRALLKEQDMPQITEGEKSEENSTPFDGKRIVDTEYSYDDEPAKK